jgi:hypothetical protein
MMVKCIKILDFAEDREISRISNGWITIGKEYLVLSVTINPGHPASFRLIGDDGNTPALYALQQFVTVSSRIPSSWQAQLDNSGNLEMAPASWLRPGYWEDYFNGQAEAVAEFETERAQIQSESSER